MITEVDFLNVINSIFLGKNILNEFKEYNVIYIEYLDNNRNIKLDINIYYSLKEKYLNNFYISPIINSLNFEDFKNIETLFCKFSLDLYVFNIIKCFNISYECHSIDISIFYESIFIYLRRINKNYDRYYKLKKLIYNI